MKSSSRFFILCSILGLGISLAGCGGHNTVNVGGTVTGLNYDGLTLDNNGTQVSIPAKATSYVFPNTVNVDSIYTVTIVKQPAHQACFVANSTGRVTGTQIDFANVGCSQVTHAITGTIANFNGAQGSLVIGNGTTFVVPPAGATTYSLPNVPEQTAYGVVIQQPQLAQAAANCVIIDPASVAAATGVMGSADVVVNINCM